MVYISASVEEYIHVGLFATVRGTFKCLLALASRPEEKPGVPQPVAIIAIGEDANNLAITRRQQEPNWPSRISRVYDGARAASTRVMCTYNITSKLKILQIKGGI